MTGSVACIIGTRPEAVKMAPVVRELERRGVEHWVISTGQHRELVHQTLQSFGVDVDVDLDLMTPGQTPTDVAARVFTELPAALKKLQPTSMVVQGDTTTVMAAAIVGAYAGILVAHLEAGLRTGDKTQPFPEELNRMIVGPVADIHLAPTGSSRQNLLREGVDPRTVFVTGNTVIDALLHARDLVTGGGAVAEEPARTRILLTAHRRENFGQPLEDALHAVAAVVQSRPEVSVRYPVHPNPNVSEPAHRILGAVDRVELCEPLGYLELVAAMDQADLIVTDSGGIQEEAPALGKPVLVLRNVTERPDAVESGVARLVGTDPDAIVSSINELLDDPAVYRAMARGSSPYGDGVAAQRVVNALLGEVVPEFCGATETLIDLTAQAQAAPVR